MCVLARPLAIGVGNLTALFKMSQKKGLSKQMWPARSDFLPVMGFHDQNQIAVAADLGAELPGGMIMQGDAASARGLCAACVNAMSDHRMQPRRGQLGWLVKPFGERRTQHGFGHG